MHHPLGKQTLQFGVFWYQPFTIVVDCVFFLCVCLVQKRKAEGSVADTRVHSWILMHAFFMARLSLLLFASQTKYLFRLCTLSYFFCTNLSPFFPLAFFRSTCCRFLPSFADFSSLLSVKMRHLPSSKPTGGLKMQIALTAHQPSLDTGSTLWRRPQGREGTGEQQHHNGT